MPKLTSRPTQQGGRFMFATGIENSYPIITDRNGLDLRVDEMAKTGHYDYWQDDFALVNELELEYLRYGPPYYKTHIGPGRYDWSFADATFAALRHRNIIPIVDLCHFGVPDWVGNFQNPDWPALFAEYAGAFAARYPWVHLYTPVNEIYVCAKFSALLGWWNERLRSDHAFVTALKHMAKANILAEQAILKVQPKAYFVQSESSEYFHPANPSVQELSDELNHRRFLSLDLCYGHHGVCQCSYEYLLDNGMSREEFHWFSKEGRALRPYQIMGNDYYITNEHLVDSDGLERPAGETLGYYMITKDYFDRYRLPVMHTETNLQNAAEAPLWLWKQWTNMVHLRDAGVPIIGFTWYSLTDQVDWDTALREDNNHINPLGLYDLHRQMRPVGRAYRDLVRQWRDVLPAQSLCLDLSIAVAPQDD